MICRICKGDKDETEFAWRYQHRSIRQNYCKLCHVLNFGRKWYSLNRDKHKAHVAIRRKRIRKELHEFIVGYLREHPCITCGQSNIIVLDFHHNGKEKKLNDVANLVHLGFSLNRVQKEIEKCDVLCANCHRIETATKGGFYRALA